MNSLLSEETLKKTLYTIPGLLLTAITLLVITLLLFPPVHAIEINPSVENQPFFCKYSVTGFLCDFQRGGQQGSAGPTGSAGINGTDNFSAIYFSPFNFTTHQNTTLLFNATNFTSYSNYTTYQTTVYNQTGLVNDSYVYKQPLTGYVGINQNNPKAPLHVGNSSTISSVDAEILISRFVDSVGSGNAHAFSDSSTVTRAGTIGYNSYDARIATSGTNAMDHYAAFQSGPTLGSSGGLQNIYGFYSAPVISSGTAQNNYGIRVNDITGAGSVTYNYGVYVGSLTKGASDFSFYANGSAPSVFEGKIGQGFLASNPVKNIEIYTANGAEAALRIRQSGQNYWDFLVPASSTRLSIADSGGEKFSIFANGTVRYGSSYGAGAALFTSTGNIVSQSYLAGTKTYYVADTAGGNTTRKLTFTNGILTGET